MFSQMETYRSSGTVWRDEVRNTAQDSVIRDVLQSGSDLPVLTLQLT